VPRRKPLWRAPCRRYAYRDATSVPNEDVSGAPAQGRRNSHHTNSLYACLISSMLAVVGMPRTRYASLTILGCIDSQEGWKMTEFLGAQDAAPGPIRGTQYIPCSHIGIRTRRNASRQFPGQGLSKVRC
jgi:hypothetical protein